MAATGSRRFSGLGWSTEMQTDDYQNALRREQDERRSADAAATDDARALHNELADRHADVAWGERERRCEGDNPC